MVIRSLGGGAPRRPHELEEMIQGAASDVVAVLRKRRREQHRCRAAIGISTGAHRATGASRPLSLARFDRPHQSGPAHVGGGAAHAVHLAPAIARRCSIMNDSVPTPVAVLLGVVLGLSAGCAVPAAPAADDRPGRKPNIVFIFADDHAYQAVGAYGSVINETPSIDRLAAEGMRFDDCFVTNSICGPSRAVILTGKYSHLNGFRRNGQTFDGSQQTFPKLLQQAGYQTAIVGKWHLGSDPQGFDSWNILIGQGPYYNPPMIDNGTRVKHTGYTTEIVTDLALAWLRQQRDPDRPFLLMLQHKAPHRSWQPSPKHLAMYDDVTIPEPPTLFDDYATRGTPARTQDMTIARTLTDYDLKFNPPRNLTEEQRAAWTAAYAPANEAFRQAGLAGADLVRWKYQRYIKDYLRCVASLDDNVGRVLDYLDEAGLGENTVVVYSSDQGFFLGEHGWFDKRWMYEPSLRTPLIVRWPGVTEPGSTSGAIVSNLDFAETFLDVAGASVPDDMQGRSLVPLLRGRTPEAWRTSFYYHYYEFPAVHSVRRHYGVRDQRYKLIHFYNLDEWELYDLQEDPLEVRNCYADPGYAGVVERMQEELQRLRALYNVPPDTEPVEPQ
jgi:arylsulfatase A-like enzyme